MIHDPKTPASHLRGALDPERSGTAEALAEALAEIPPSGSYTCGCPWSGWSVPHYCPTHPDAPVVFEIRDL